MKRPKGLRPACSLVAAASIWLGVTTPVFAHSVNSRFGDFYGGMLHPLTALEHMLPILGMGLLAGQQGPRPARWMLLLFAIGLLTGALISPSTTAVAYALWINRISLIAIGVLVALSKPLPLPCLSAVALGLGMSHGYENTADIPSTVVTSLFVPGIMVSGVVLVAVGAAVVVSRNVVWQRIAVRVVGSWIAAIGILMLGVT